MKEDRVRVQVKRLTDEGKMPKAAKDGDVAFDLFSNTSERENNYAHGKEKDCQIICGEGKHILILKLMMKFSNTNQ